MGVYRRGCVWYIDYSFNGRRVRKAVGTSKKVAVLALSNVKLKKARSEFLGIKEPKKVLFDNLCVEYLEYSEANKRPQSYRRDVTSTKSLLNVFSGKLLTEITARGVEDYKNMRRDEVKPATVNRELACMNHMLNKAVQWKYLTENPMQCVSKFTEPPGRTRYLSEEETHRLLDNCSEHTRPIVIMALNTGMRKGEILTLKWQDIDMRQRLIIVRNSKNNESRTLPVNNELHATLKMLGPQQNGQFVFSHTDGMPYRDIKDGFSAALKRAHIGDFRFHDLRHTYAVYLAKQGVSIMVINKLLGHKTMAMTMRYAQFTDQHMFRKAVDRLRFSAYNDTQFVTNPSQLTAVKK